MERASHVWARLASDPASRWIAYASVPPLWLSIARVDARFLILIPLAAVLVHGGFRLRDRVRPPRDDDFVI
jgi:hypothetical protein